jgi:predicted TPR repeat methyltransferase
MSDALLQAHKTAAENALQSADFPQLIQIFLACLANHPRNPLLHNDLAKAYLKVGDRHAAKKHFIEALHLDPHRVETICQLAIFHKQEGNFTESIRFFQKALRINPLTAQAHYQLANTYSMQNQFDLALTHYHEALQYGANATDIHRNLGMIYFGENQWERAARHLQHAFDAAPNDLIGLPLGQALLNVGQPKAAQQVYEKIVQQYPNCHDAHHNLGILHLKAQDKLSAKRHFSAAAALQPENATAQHMLAALSENQTVTEAPLAYTKALFDQYAPYYDQHMQGLKYDVPLVIRNLLGELIPTHAQNLSMLDLGCGTGRCGLYCRDLAHTLIGIDLSDKMLGMAKALGAYDTLTEAPLQQYLENTTDTFDIITAAEVLNYVGNLTPLWPAIIKTLKPGGYFVFTTEHSVSFSNNAENKGYFLAHTGRFTHHADIIQQQIESHPTLILKQYQDLTLRQGNDKPILGRLWCILKTCMRGSLMSITPG